MAKRGGGDNLFLLVALGIGALAFTFLREKKGPGPATATNGTAGGGVPGSPNQVVEAAPGIPFNYNSPFAQFGV